MSELESGAPPSEPAVAAPPAEPQVAVQPVDEDTALDAELDSTAIDLPDGEDKLVPLSAVTKLRERLKVTKGQAARVGELEQQLGQHQEALRQAAPYIDAAKALLASRQMQQDQPRQAKPEPDDPLAEQLAKVIDLYAPDGTIDKGKGKQLAGLFRQMAGQVAQEAVAPHQQRTVNQDAAYMLQRAKATVFPDGETADPQMLEALWARVDPSVAANPEGAKWLAVMAKGASQRKAAPAAQKAEIPEPLFTEKAGGKDGPAMKLTDSDAKLAKDLGMTQAEYAKIAAAKPW